MSNTVTITGTLVDVTGTPQAGQVVIELCNFGSQPPVITGTDIIADVKIVLQAATNGTWSTVLFLNNAITPSTTFYTITISPAGSTCPLFSAPYLFNTAGTFD